MLDVNSAAVFAVERPVPLNDFEQVRIINAINAIFFFAFKNPVNDSKILDMVQFTNLD